MRTMTLREAGGPLVPERRPDPVPELGQLRLKVAACGVGRTDLHVVDGDLPSPRRGRLYAQVNRGTARHESRSTPRWFLDRGAQGLQFPRG